MILDKPSLDELVVLEHHGVKGMRWGVRKDRESSSSSGGSDHKTAKRVGVGVLVVGGAAAATYILAKNGHFPAAQAFGMSFKSGMPTTPDLRPGLVKVTLPKPGGGTQTLGKEAIDALNENVWSKSSAELSNSHTPSNVKIAAKLFNTFRS